MNSPASIQINNNGALQDYFTISDIIEFGENANGTYIKFSSGLMICNKYGTTNSTSLQFDGHYAYGKFNYPSQFMSPPSICCGMYTAMTTGCYTLVSDHTYDSNPLVSVTLFFTTPQLVDLPISTGYCYSYISIGRWK